MTFEIQRTEKSFNQIVESVGYSILPIPIHLLIIILILTADDFFPPISVF